jgi:Tfp pilus assembly pilus retraction ATPase PilT
MMNSKPQSLTHEAYKMLLRSVPEVILLGEVRDPFFERVLNADVGSVRFTCLRPSAADACMTDLLRRMECPHQPEQAVTKKDKP